MSCEAEAVAACRNVARPDVQLELFCRVRVLGFATPQQATGRLHFVANCLDNGVHLNVWHLRMDSTVRA